MAGSLEDNAAVYKKQFYKFVPPTPPGELLDCECYVLDFVERKFIHIGLDPADQFNVVVHMITSSRHVVITVDFLHRVYSLMGNILALILDPNQKAKIVFLKDERVTLSKITYRGENTIVIESHAQDGCRVLLSRSDIIKLSNLEFCIFEAINRKTTIVRPSVLQQFEQMADYIKKEFPEKVEDRSIYVQSVHDMAIKNNVAKFELNFVSQIKLFVNKQLVQLWSLLDSASEQKSTDENDGPMFFLPNTDSRITQLNAV